MGRMFKFLKTQNKTKPKMHKIVGKKTKQDELQWENDS